MSSSTPSETVDRDDERGFLTDVTDSAWWRPLFDRLVAFTAQNPGTFLYYLMLGLTPIFLVSAVLSWKLAKHLEKEEKDKKRKAKREAGIAKARSNAVAAAANDKSSASSTPSKNAKTPPQQQSAKSKGRQKGHNKRE